MHWNGQPTNKEGIHLQNKNIHGGKDYLSTISMVIIKERGHFSQCQGLRSRNYAFRLKKAAFI